MPTPRLLVAMALATLVAILGALFLGEYEFDETLPIAAGILLGYIIAEVVVSIGRQRSPALAAIVAVWAATAVLLAGWLDTNENEPIKTGAYLSALGSAVVAAGRANRWRTPASSRPADGDQAEGDPADVDEPTGI